MLPNQMFNAVLSSLRTFDPLSDTLDILIISFVFYQLLQFARKSRAGQLVKGIILILVFYGLAVMLNLKTVTWVLNNVITIGFMAAVVIFQPEIRRAMERFGGKFFLNLVDPASKKSVEESAIEATVSACEIMSKERVGVLLIFERSVSLEEYFKTGTLIDAKVTEQLLRNLFFPKASLHDRLRARIAKAGNYEKK